MAHFIMSNSLWEVSERDASGLYDGLALRGYGQFIEHAFVFAHGKMIDKTNHVSTVGFDASAYFESSRTLYTCDLITGVISSQIT